PTFVFTAQAIERAGSRTIQTSRQRLLADELGMVLKAMHRELRKGKGKCRISDKYFLSPQFSNDFRKKTGRRLNRQKLYFMRQELQRMQFIVVHAGRGARHSRSNKYLTNLYEFGARPAELPMT